jgi:hypothetical protein
MSNPARGPRLDGKRMCVEYRHQQNFYNLGTFWFLGPLIYSLFKLLTLGLGHYNSVGGLFWQQHLIPHYGDREQLT